MYLNVTSASRQSAVNSTTTSLANNATFTGTWELDNEPDVLVTVRTDQSGILYMEFSPDGINTDSSLSFAITGSLIEIHKLIKGFRYYRTRFTNNSGSSQTYLRLQTCFGAYGPITSPLNLSAQQDADAVITKGISDELSMRLGLLTGYSCDIKYGHNTDVDTVTVPEDIWDGGGTYTGFPASAETIDVSSSSANDTSAGTGARSLRLFGFDSNYNAIQEDVTLNGITKVTTAKQFLRMYRSYILTAGSGTVNAGDITIQHTSTTANIFSVMPSGYGQSQICAYTIPAGYTGYLRNFFASMGDNTANTAVMTIWTKNSGVVRQMRPFFISTAFQNFQYIYGGIPLNEKTDIAIRCLSVQNSNANISASFDLVLVKN